MKKIVLVFVLLVWVGGAWAQQFDQQPLQAALNADGTLQQGARGSFSTQGYAMQTDPTGKPRFVPSGAMSVVGTPNTWDSQFSLPNGTNSRITCIATDGAGNWYIGGLFTSVGGTPNVKVNYIARFNTTTNTWSALTGADGGNGVSVSVGAIAVSGNTVYVGCSTAGTLTANVGGITVAFNGVARFNTTTNTWSALTSLDGGNGVNGFVSSLAISGSDVFVGGGSITQANVGGTTVGANNIARFNIATNTWSALTGAGGGNGVSGQVNAIAVLGNDVFVGGNFTATNVFGPQQVIANYVARFDYSNNTWNSLGATGNGVAGSGFPNVFALSIADGKLFVGGFFATANAGGSPVTANNVAQFDIASNTWSALGSGLNGICRAIAANTTEVFVGGEFTTAGGLPANIVARFNLGTTSWSKLGTDGNGINDYVYGLATEGTNLFIGGAFGIANSGGTTLPINNITKFDIGTNVFTALGSGTGNGVSRVIFAIAVLGNDVFVGGSFRSVGGISANGVARFNTITNTWSALGTGEDNGVSAPGAFVNALTILSGNLYVGGVFTSVAGAIPANNVARYNISGNTWSALTGAGGNGVNSTVNALAVSGNDVFVGGFFTQANVGAPVATSNIARFNTVSNTWSALGTGLPTQCFALAVLGDDLFAGGEFTSAGGTPVSRVARYNTVSNTWSALTGAGGGNGVIGAGFTRVSALAAAGTNVFVGGIFNTANVGGATVAANNIARFNTSSNEWFPLTSSGVDGFVRGILISGSDVFAGGTFTSAGGVGANKIARYNLALNSWTVVGSGAGNGADGDVIAFGINNNNLFVGGFFGTVNVGEGVFAANFAQYFFVPALSAPTSAAITINTATTQTLSWTAGLGSIGTLVVRSPAGGSLSGSPVNGTSYSVGQSLLGGTVVAVGSATTAVATGLTQSAGYQYQLFAFNGTNTYSTAVSVSGTTLTAAAAVTLPISANGTFTFPGTGVIIEFSGVVGSGTITVERYTTPAGNIAFSGATPSVTSPYSFIITATGFTFSSALLRFDRTEIPDAGISNPATVTVYSRPAPGTGLFAALPNAFNAGFPNEVRATTTTFSEFIFGSGGDNPLPVELSAFTGGATANGVRLAWTTQSETNNIGFSILRGGAVIAGYESINTLRGKGTTTNASSYGFVDATVEAGRTYSYSLRSHDLSGTVHNYPQTITVEVRETPNVRYEYALMQNYPNPFNPSTMIRYTMQAAGAATLTVTDMLGRTVVSETMSAGAGVNEYRFNGAKLTSGTYFYQLRAAGFSQTRKMTLIK